MPDLNSDYDVPQVDHGYVDMKEVEEIDRCARAYGWEIGRGHPMVETISECTLGNPFLDPNWRKVIYERKSTSSPTGSD